MTMRRRDAIKTLGALAGGAGASRLLTGCGDNDAAGFIDTWVFMMMENRSYDHALGARSMLEGLPGDGLESAMGNEGLDGVNVPIWPATEADLCVMDPPHSWDPQRVALDGGACDGFLRAHQTQNQTTDITPMQYMTRQRLPVSWALADAYTTFDRWFSALLGPTLPNRMYWHAGSSNGAKSNDDVIGGAFRGLTSIYHRLEAAGVPWAYYYGDLPVLGVLENLDLDGKLRRFNYDFFDDAMAGRLPPVVYIDPQFGWNDDHPPHHLGLGQQLVSSVYTALATSAHWERCMLVLTYDENGGFFDHVPPPKTADERAGDGFDQLGFRVPAFAIGPYVKQGFVSSVVHNHTSALRHLQNTFDLEPLNQRVDAATDLSECLDLERLTRGRPSPPITLPVVDVDISYAEEHCLGSSIDIGGLPVRGHGGGGGGAPVPGHDVIEFCEAMMASGRLDRKYDLRRSGRENVIAIGEYLRRHGLGSIKR